MNDNISNREYIKKYFNLYDIENKVINNIVNKDMIKSIEHSSRITKK